MQALMTGQQGRVRQIYEMAYSPSWMALAAQLNSVTAGQLLQLITATSSVKVQPL